MNTVNHRVQIQSFVLFDQLIPFLDWQLVIIAWHHMLHHVLHRLYNAGSEAIIWLLLVLHNWMNIILNKTQTTFLNTFSCVKMCFISYITSNCSNKLKRLLELHHVFIYTIFPEIKSKTFYIWGFHLLVIFDGTLLSTTPSLDADGIAGLIFALVYFPTTKECRSGREGGNISVRSFLSSQRGCVTQQKEPVFWNGQQPHSCK